MRAVLADHLDVTLDILRSISRRPQRELWWKRSFCKRNRRRESLLSVMNTPSFYWEHWPATESACQKK